MAKKKLNLRIENRIVESMPVDDIEILPETRWHKIKEELRYSMLQEAQNRVDIMNYLYEIREKKLWVFDSYKNFNEFLVDFKFSRSQAFKYLQIIDANKKGLVSDEEMRSLPMTEILKNLPRKTKSVKKMTYKLILNNPECFGIIKKLDKDFISSKFEEFLLRNKDEFFIGN